MELHDFVMAAMCRRQMESGHGVRCRDRMLALGNQLRVPRCLFGEGNRDCIGYEYSKLRHGHVGTGDGEFAGRRSCVDMVTLSEDAVEGLRTCWVLGIVIIIEVLHLANNI